MKTKLLMILFCLLMLPMVLADTEIYAVNEDIELKFTCSVDGQIPTDATFNITINYPNGSIFINNSATTPLGNGMFNYNTQFKETGLYKSQMFCYDGTDKFLNTGYYEITPTGIKQTSILDNPILLILGLLGIVIVIFAIATGNPFMGFIGSVLFILLGVYTMIYGFNNVTDMYTRGVAMTFIGIGIFIMFASAYDWVFGGEDE